MSRKYVVGGKKMSVTDIVDLLRYGNVREEAFDDIALVIEDLNGKLNKEECAS